jgi:glyoxylase-like metal-dependent hydrolase (beta-lactamase superfamily II)
VKKVKDNLYVIQGGGNSSVIIGQNGVIVVDAKTTLPAGKGVVDEVAKLTKKPITTAIPTHSDGDHVNGLPAFPKGVTIIAHKNDKKEIEQAQAAGARGGARRAVQGVSAEQGHDRDAGNGREQRREADADSRRQPAYERRLGRISTEIK